MDPDAKVLVCMVHMISNISSYDKLEFSTVFEAFGPLLTGTKYSTLANLTYSLLIFGSPLRWSLEEVVALVSGAHERMIESKGDGSSGSGSGDNANGDIKEFSDYLYGKCQVQLNQETAESILKQINLESNKFGTLKTGEISEFDEFLFKLVQTGLYRNSEYLDDISLSDQVIHILEGYPSFGKWYSQFYSPFKYYWDNYGLINNSIKYHEFLKLSKQESFNTLISPLATKYSSKLEPGNWFDRVIIPVLAWHKDFEPLNKWLFNQENVSNKTYTLWNLAIKSLIEKEINISDYTNMIQNFLAVCYYDKDIEKPLEMLNHFDTIKSTTLLLIPIVPKSDKGPEIVYEEEEFSDLQAFIAGSSLQPLFQVTKQNIIILSEMIESCIKLYPINKTTVSKFLKLKYQQNDIEHYKREVSRMLVGIQPSNSKTLISSLELFKLIFIGENDEINELIIDRYLFNNLFDLIDEKLAHESLGIPNESLFQLVLKKFWECINQAESLDSKELVNAQKCIDLFDKVGSNEEVIRLKHLMKVFNNIKNFKLSINHKPIKPCDVLKRFGTLPSIEELRTEMESISPMGLITTILEQNPKSYLAFDKLFKILNDFLIVLKDDLKSNYYFNRLMSACIESSLIDNNFQYGYKKALDLVDSRTNLNDVWLTFYQLGKYQTAEFYEDPNSLNNLVILTKQNEVLSKYLKVINRTDVSIDNSRLILELWEKINQHINDIFDETVESSSREVTPSNNTEKLSNLLEKGLGWAIGASR